MSEVMIEVKNLSKKFEGGEALKNVSLSVCRGEICAVAGKAGSGKSTLTDLLTGVIEPDEGSISILDLDVVEYGSQAKQHLGYAPAQPALYGDMTPRTGMKFVADARGMSFREAGDRISKAVKQFAIKDIADTPVKNLSFGARKVASLAQAVFTGAEVIVIDEPTAGLNPKEIFEMREMIKALKEKHAVLLTSENASELCAVADRVLLMDAGKIIAEGRPDELHMRRTDFNTLLLTVRGDKETVCKAMDSIEGAERIELNSVQDEWDVALRVKDGADVREAVFKAVCAHSLILLGMRYGEKSVEDVLMALSSERTAYSEEAKEEQGDESDL